jgi:hypothetical protein
MMQNLTEQVSRIKEIMGIINEGSIVSWIDEFFKVATNNKVILNSLKTLEQKVSLNNIELIKKSIEEGIGEGLEDSKSLKDAIIKVGEKKGLSYNDTIVAIIKNQKDIEKSLVDELVNIKVKNIINEVSFSNSIDDLVKKKLNSYIKTLYDSQLNQTIESLKKLDSNVLKTELERRIKNIENGGFDDTIKNFWKDIYSTVAKEKNIKLFEVDDLTKRAQERMKERFSFFRNEFKKSFDLAVSKFGTKWEEILGPEIVENTNDGLNILEKLFGDKKWYFGDGQQQLTISEIRKKFNEYKGFKGDNGEWSSINFLDTNSLDNTQFFLNQAKQILSDEEYIVLMSKFADDTITKDDEILRKVLDKIENDKNLWDDMVVNPSNYLTNIPKTTSAGSEGEELAVGWFRTMEDVNVLWRASTGSPLDRLLGIDFILEVGGEASTINVKKFSGTIYTKINMNDVLGDAFRIWSKYGVTFSKQSNLTYGVLVDSNGALIMFKKQPGVDWVLQSRTNVERLPTARPNGYMYVDNVEGVRLYFKEGTSSTIKKK